MKFFIIFLFVLASSASWAQNYSSIPLESYSNKPIYIAASNNSDADVYFSKGIKFRIIPAQFVQVQKKVDLENPNIKEQIARDGYSYISKESHHIMHFVKTNTDPINASPDTFILIPSISHKSVCTKTLSLDELVTSKGTYYVDSLVEDAHCEWDKMPETTVTGKEEYYLKPGYYSGWDRLPSSGLVLLVQLRLNELGYTCPINNKLGAETRNALISFERDNGLPAGSPVPMLKLLEIEGY